MSEIDLVQCRKCKRELAPFLFSPSQLKKGSPGHCRKCMSERNKSKYIKAYAPADHQFGCMGFGRNDR